MAPAPYLLHVNSGPKDVSDELWAKWYIDEHLPDLVNSKTSVRASFYEEFQIEGAQPPGHPRKFLALYQTEFEESLKTDNYTSLRTTSELFAKEGGTPNIGDNGDFDARNYELVQAYDPNRLGEVAPAFLVTVEMHPNDEADYDKWYREEHLDLMSKIRGYRRTLRYKFGPKTPLTKDEIPPTYLALHEFDNFDGVGTPEHQTAAGTEWSVKNVENSKVFIVRMWKRLHEEGF